MVSDHDDQSSSAEIPPGQQIQSPELMDDDHVSESNTDPIILSSSEDISKVSDQRNSYSFGDVRRPTAVSKG